MSLATYSGLVEAVAALLNRSDLTSYVPDWVTMCEAELNRRLDTRQMEETTTLTIDGASEALPARFGGVKAFQLDLNDGVRMEYVSPSVFDTLSNVTGNPLYYTISGSYFWFAHPPGGTFSARLRYRALLDALGDSTPSNWLLAAYPDAYLYGVALHSAPFLNDDNRITLWQGKFDQIIDQINTEARKQRQGSPLITRSGLSGAPIRGVR